MARRRGPYKPRQASTATQEMEIEATLFAIYLLLPEELVRQEVSLLAPNGFDVVDDPAIGAMAYTFRVSTQLMMIRLIQLGYFEALF